MLRQAEGGLEPKATVASAHGEMARAWVADSAGAAVGTSGTRAQPLSEVTPPESRHSQPAGGQASAARNG